MAILWCDSFNSYGTTSDMSKAWGSNTDTTNVTLDLTAGPSSDPVAKIVGASVSNRALTGTLYATPAGTTLGGRFKFKRAALGSSQNIFGVSATDATYFNLQVDSTTGRLGITPLRSLIVLASGYGTTNICDNTWHVIEWQLLVSDSVGTAKIWIDGVLEVNLSGIDTFNGTTPGATPWGTAITLGAPGGLANSSSTNYYKDVVVFDSAGVSGNLRTADQPFGNIVIATLRPSGAGTTTQFTPSAGSNFQCVDETAQDGNTSYVEDTVSGHRDLYAMGNLGLSPTTVYGVVAKVFATNPGSLSISMKQTLKSNVTTTANTATVTNLIGDYKTQVYDLDPDINAVWTGTTVDAVEQGFEVA